MKKNNALNILTLRAGYLWKYPSKWPSNIRFQFRKIKWVWQRATKGYSDWDLWDLDLFYQRLFSASIKEFAERTEGWPGGDFSNFEEWQKYLLEIARLFKESIEGEESIKNEYEEAYFQNIFNRDLTSPESPEETELREKFFKRDDEITQYRADCLNTAFEMFCKYFGHFWW